MVRMVVDESLNKLACSLALKNASQQVVSVAVEWLAADYITLFYVCAAYEVDLAINLNISPAANEYPNADSVPKFVAIDYITRRIFRQEVITKLTLEALLALSDSAASLKEIAAKHNVHPFNLRRRIVFSGITLLRNFQSYLRAFEQR